MAVDQHLHQQSLAPIRWHRSRGPQTTHQTLELAREMVGKSRNVIEWSQRVYGLGVEEMDTTHAEFAALVNSIAQADAPEDLQILFTKLLDHTRGHFTRESELMREIAATASQIAAIAPVTEICNTNSTSNDCLKPNSSARIDANAMTVCTPNA